jgi:hypothetical protein
MRLTTVDIIFFGWLILMAIGSLIYLFVINRKRRGVAAKSTQP